MFLQTFFKEKKVLKEKIFKETCFQVYLCYNFWRTESNTESRVFSTTRKLIILGKTAVGAESSRQGREQGRKEAARGFPSSK